MADPRFYVCAGPFELGALATLTRSALGPRASATHIVRDIAALESAEAGEIAYVLNAKLAQAARGRPGIALIVPPNIAQDGLSEALLLNNNPSRAFAEIAATFYPASRQPEFKPGVAIDQSAKIGTGARIGAGVAIGADAEIGDGTLIAPNAVIGAGVRIGRNCRIGANVSIAFTLIGDRVILHPGSSLGQDGFGYVPSMQGHLKIPQLGRLIVQNDVEIGSCCTIDRGALGDTVIGEGTKLDNLVHVAHNCRIGRHAFIAGMVGLSGSVVVEDYVMMAGQVGVSGHLKVGAGARLAGGAGVISDVPAGATYGGFPAKPRLQWLREVAWLTKSVTRKRGAAGSKAEPPDNEET